MKHHLKLISLVSTGALLGCSQLSLSQREPVSDRSASVLNRVKLPAKSAGVSAAAEIENFWLQGRAAQGQGQLALAREHYTRVLQRQPSHVGAMNALAVLDAQSGRLDEAIAQFQKALVLEPAASHLYNNLGYALLLAGRLTEAEAALLRAQQINPASTLTQKNRELLAQARTRGATVQASAAQPPVASEAGRLLSVAPSVYELRDPPAAVARATRPAPLAAAAPSVPVSQATRPAAPQPGATANPGVATKLLDGVRIEVSNGVGVRHMARRTAERLAPLGVVARLTNQPGYQQVRTEIQYLPSQAQAAQALASQLPQAPHLQVSRQLVGQAQLRLVLGHDQVVKSMLGWLDGADGVPLSQGGDEAQQAPVALSLHTGWRWG